MSGDDVSPEHLALSSLSFGFKEGLDDRPSPYPYRKHSVPMTSSSSRTAYGRRRSRNSPLGTPTRGPRSSRRTSLPAIHLPETRVSTLHLEPRTSGQPNHALIAHLNKFTFGQPPSEPVEHDPDGIVPYSADYIRRHSDNLNDIPFSPRFSNHFSDDVLRRPSTRPESRKSEINISYILSEDTPVAVIDDKPYISRMSESDLFDMHGDSFINHINRVEPDLWKFMRDYRLGSFSEYDHANRPPDDARERWWCEPLGRFCVCKKATASQSRTSSGAFYNRLKIRRLPLDSTSSYVTGPPVLVHRHSKSDAFSIYRYFGDQTQKQRMDSSFTIILGTQKTLSAHYFFKRNRRSRQTSNTSRAQNQKETQTEAVSPMGTGDVETFVQVPKPSNSMQQCLPNSISIKTTGLPKLAAKLSPNSSRGASLSPTSNVVKSQPEAPSPQRKNFLRTFFGTFSFNKDESHKINRKDETEDIIDYCRYVGLLPAEPPKRRRKTLAFDDLSAGTMCMLLPLWPEPGQSSSGNASQTYSSTNGSSLVPSVKNRKYLLVYYEPTVSSTRTNTRLHATGGKFDGTFCAFGRVLRYHDLRDAAIVLPERGLCVNPSVPSAPVTLNQFDSQDPVLAIATKEQEIMICHDSFTELGLTDLAGPTAVEMGKAIAEMVWCGCITLLNFKS